MLNDWQLRLRSIFKRRAVEEELDDELRFHFDRLVDRHLESGLMRDEALRRARVEFGGFDQIKEEHREARAIGFIDDAGRDLSYAFRQLRRSPVFALLAILCLGLGIGANSSIFAALNSALLRPLPVSDPDRVVMITRGQNWNFSHPTIRRLPTPDSVGQAKRARLWVTMTVEDAEGRSTSVKSRPATIRIPIV